MGQGDSEERFCCTRKWIVFVRFFVKVQPQNGERVEFGVCDWCGIIPGVEKWAVFLEKKIDGNNRH